ncbi:MAG: hypothetical protein ACRC10_05535 [Thermoguttaceae bacterium]
MQLIQISNRFDTNTVTRSRQVSRFRTFVPGAATTGALEGATLGKRSAILIHNLGPYCPLRGTFRVLRDRNDQYVSWSGLLDGIGLKWTKKGIYYANKSVYPDPRTWPNLVNTQFGTVIIANGRAADPVGVLRWGGQYVVFGLDQLRTRWGSANNVYRWLHSGIQQRFDVMQNDPLYMWGWRQSRRSSRFNVNITQQQGIGAWYSVLNRVDPVSAFTSRQRVVLDNLIQVWARSIATDLVTLLYSGPYPIEYGISLPDGEYESWSVTQGQLWPQIITGKVTNFVVKNRILDNLPKVESTDWSVQDDILTIRWKTSNGDTIADAVFEIVFHPSMTTIIVPHKQLQQNYLFSARTADTTNVTITPIKGEKRGDSVAIPIDLTRPSTPVQGLHDENSRIFD